MGYSMSSERMTRDKELFILDAALSSLLDNFMFEPEDYSHLDMSEQDIRDMIEKIFHEQQKRMART